MAKILVLTGGPCSGKTTLIERLAHLGHPVLEETATEIIRSDPGGELRVNPLSFQRAILARQILREETCLEKDTSSPFVFADRGIGDHFAYLRMHGLEPFPELLEAWESAVRRYRAVFLLELNPSYQASRTRQESRRQAARLHEALEEEYSHRHPTLIAIPWLPLEERLDRLLGEVKRLA